MPVNQILAPAYCLIKYTTDVPYQHVVRLYFDTVPTFSAGGNRWLFDSYTDATHPLGWSLRQIITDVFSRLNNTSTIPTLKIDEVEVWQSAPGANVFLGLDPDDYTLVVGGARNSDPSAYTMFVAKAADRTQFRFTIFDTQNSSPQRFSVGASPLVDDTGLAWFLTRSVVNFVTNDNKRLTLVASINHGYNRKLARSYGRRLHI